MEVWPAIDLRGGKCVRLVQGDYHRETVFDDEPARAAERWKAAGAERLHLVDLDGARDGQLANLAAVRAILRASRLPCQFGGGVRDEARLVELLELGLSRLVVGTQALRQPDWFRDMCRKYPHKLVLGLDARDGWIAAQGWLETSAVRAIDLARRFADEPVAAIVYTDIARDGTLTGPNLPALAEMRAASRLPIVASGGVSRASDLREIAALGVAGCIVGRALYEEKFTLLEARQAAGEAPG